MPTKTVPAKADPEVWIARLQGFVAAFDAMENENEQRAALYWLISGRYGNAVGNDVLDSIPRED